MRGCYVLKSFVILKHTKQTVKTKGVNMANKSIAQMVREARGIVQEKNPKNVEKGLKGAIAQGKTNPIKELRKQTVKIPKGGLKAYEKTIQEANQLKDKIQSLQAIKKKNALDVIIENSDLVAKRLVDLALGQNTFHDAPASVQRLAMIDVLTLAGITGDQAEKQAKDVKDMSREELESFLRATAAIVEKVNTEQPTVIEGETISTDSIIDQLR